MRLALLLLTLTVCWTNAQSTIANGTLANATLNGASPLRDGLLAYYKLDETSGTRYDAYSTNNLTDNNSVGSTAGKVGNAATFKTSSSQSLSCSAISSFGFDRANPFSVSMWCKLTNNASYHILCGKWDSTSFKGWSLATDSPSGRPFVSLQCAETSQIYAVGPSNIVDNNWWFLTATYDGTSTTNGVVLYINGNTDYASGLSGSFSSSIVSTGNPFCIGSRGTSGVSLFPANGLIDEVGVWNRVLTAAEISTLYKSGTGTTFPYFSRRSPTIDFDWDNWQPLQLPEQIPVAFLNRKPTLISLCE